MKPEAYCFEKGMENSMTEKRKVGIAAFGLPVLLVLVIMIGTGVYPFGDNSLLVWDMDWQYSSFFVHLHDIMHGEASPWYSFSRAIGGDMIGVAAYYLISPFNLLFYFFDANNIYIGITLVLLLKVGCIGWAMCHYLYHRRQSADVLIFSTAYALSGYVVGYFFNIMWLDGIMLLPLMVKGIEQLVEERKYLLYVCTIALGVITNFYIGYMLCIFSVLYFVCYFFLISEKKKSIKTILLYGVSSLLGGALSACVALPTVYAMQGGKSAIDLKILKNLSLLLDYRGLLSEVFLGMIDDLQMTMGSPLIYCGVLTVILIPCFFLFREIPWKKKAAYLFMMASIVVSFGLYNLCSAWQAFNLPNGSPYRFSFLYIFVALLAAEEAYAKLRNRKYILMGTGVAVLLLFVAVGRSLIQIQRTWLFAANILFIISYVLVMVLIKNQSRCTKVVLVLISAELCMNALSLYHYSPSYESTKVSEYKEYVQKVEKFADELKGNDELYRTVLTGEAYRTVNDSMLWNLYGLDSYTSVERDSTQLIAFNLGYYRNMIFGIHYNEGSTRAAESLLGVKYLVTSEEPEAGYDLLMEDGSLGLYENQSALPVAMMAEGTLLAANNDEYNTFEYQNQIYASLCNEMEEPVFTPVKMQQTKLYSCVENADGSFETVNSEIDGCIEYRLTVEKEGNYYLQHIRSGASRVVAIVNGEVIELAEQGNVVKQLGYLYPGDDVLIRCFISGDGQRYLDEVLVYYEDMDILSSYAKKVKTQQVTVTHEREDKVIVSCKNEEKRRRYLLVTIPYDEGWTVMVDGWEVTPYIAVNNLMVIGVEPGEHEIILTFVPQGQKEGLAVTAAAAVLLIISYMVIRLRKKKEHGEKEN